MPDTSPHLPRIVIERSAAHDLTLEYYINGQRQRTALTRGIELHEIHDALDRQEREIKAKAERQREADEALRRQRHNSNVGYMRNNYGDHFTSRIYGEHFAKPAAKVQPAAKVGKEITAADLL